MSGWLEELIRVAEFAEDVGMVASRIALFDQRSHLDSAGMAIYPDLLAKQRGRLGPFDDFPAVEEILLPSACAALYRREMLEEVGFFDEEFVAYCEDTDLGLRGRLRMAFAALPLPLIDGLEHRVQARSDQS